MDIRTLLFANALVFTILAIAMVLVWRGNRTVPGLASLARVHAAMIGGTVLIGLRPGLVPGVLSMLAGNTLVVLSVVWLLAGIRGLYGLPRDDSPKVVLPLWAASLLYFLYVQPSLRARILTTSCVWVVFLLRAVWTTRLGLRKPEERSPSLLVAGSLGLLVVVFAARFVYYMMVPRVDDPVGSDVLTMAMVTTSLLAATGWTFGVMELVYVRLNKEARQARAAVEQLVQVAAHELRSPLTSIVGTLGLLSNRPAAVSEEDQHRLLAMAQRNSVRMARLIDDLLDLERVESGRASFEVELVDLEKLLQQALEMSEGQARRLGVTVELCSLSHAMVRADSQRLLQVVVNLLSNAIKFSPPGAAVRLGVARNDRRVRVEVADRGPGIPREFRGRVFQRFARGASPGSTEPAKGSGLGLAISKALIEGMGGRIGFETEEGAGSTFYFELPAAAS